VNVRPKMSSSLGTSFFGVMVLVIVSFEGSIPGSRAMRSSSTINFSLRRAVEENDLVSRSDSDDEREEKERAPLRSRRGRNIMLCGKHRQRGKKMVR
jgi:hypothetical protein